MRGSGEFAQARADLRALGATEESIKEAHGDEDEDFLVWPENWLAVRAFLAVSSQWNVGMNGPTGLDYSRVRAGLEMAGIEVTPELFGKLRMLESAALALMGGKAKEAK